MAIGKLLPRTAPPPAPCQRIGPTGDSLPESLATTADGRQTPIRLKILEALSLRRYHSRKRNVKPVLMALSIIRLPANCLPLKWHFSRDPSALSAGPRQSGFGRLQPEPPGAAAAERLF